jgi:hypothetical protein
MTDSPPSELWLGKVDHNWPVHAFTAEGHAIDWLQRPKDGERRRIWKAQVTLGEELTLVEPAPYLEPIAQNKTTEPQPS